MFALVQEEIKGFILVEYKKSECVVCSSSIKDWLNVACHNVIKLLLSRGKLLIWLRLL